MLVKAKCKTCGAISVFDKGDATTEEAINELSKGKSFCAECNQEQDIPPIHAFDFDWETPVQALPMTDEMFKLEVQRKFGEALTLEEVELEFDIESRAYGACLCSRKSDGGMILFSFLESPDGNKYYYRTGGIQ